MNKYILKLKHDNGIVSLFVIARNERDAKDITMKCENCPERAIFSIRKISKI